MELCEEKKALRRAVKARSEGLSKEYRESADRAIRDRVTAWPLWQRAESVFLYVSVRREPDTLALLRSALEAGKRVYVPRCYGAGVMRALRLERLDDLTCGTLGIPEPPEEAVEAPDRIDLSVIPCVTAGLDGGRLGHGAGYYDRFLATHETTTACLCHAGLLTEGIPMGALDRRMDYIITENGIVKAEAD